MQFSARKEKENNKVDVPSPDACTYGISQRRIYYVSFVSHTWPSPMSKDLRERREG